MLYTKLNKLSLWELGRMQKEILIVEAQFMSSQRGTRILPRTCIMGYLTKNLSSFCPGPENLSEVDLLVIINYNLELWAKIKPFSLRLLFVRVFHNSNMK